jgi:ABC-2 type transport system permease protein
MLRNVWTKSIYERRWALLAWCLGIGATALLTMSFYPSFNQQGIDQIVNSVPDSLKSLIGSADSFKTIPGFIAQQIYGPQIPIFIIVMAIVLFNGVSGVEEERGTLQTLLAQPISRTSVYMQKILAVAMLLVVACLAIAIGVELGLLAIHEHAPTSRILQATFACWLMSLAYGMVAYAVAMGSGNKSLALGIASAYAFGSFVISSLAPAVSYLAAIDRLSIFHYYNAHPVMQHGLTWAHIAVLLCFNLIVGAVGLVRFTKRDIGV